MEPSCSCPWDSPGKNSGVVFHSLLQGIFPTQGACLPAKLLQSHSTLCDPMDCSLPGSTVHGILQARILEWLATPSFRGSSQPRYQTHVSYVSCIGEWFLYHYFYLGSPFLTQKWFSTLLNNNLEIVNNCPSFQFSLKYLRPHGCMSCRDTCTYFLVKLILEKNAKWENHGICRSIFERIEVIWVGGKEPNKQHLLCHFFFFL